MPAAHCLLSPLDRGGTQSNVCECCRPQVKMRYIGRLASNGKIFDQTRGNKTFAFRLGAQHLCCEHAEVGARHSPAAARVATPGTLALHCLEYMGFRGVCQVTTTSAIADVCRCGRGDFRLGQGHRGHAGRRQAETHHPAVNGAPASPLCYRLLCNGSEVSLFLAGFECALAASARAGVVATHCFSDDLARLFTAGLRLQRRAARHPGQRHTGAHLLPHSCCVLWRQERTLAFKPLVGLLH